MDRSSKHKIKKETQALNDTVYQRDSIDVYRTFHSIVAEYTFSQVYMKHYSGYIISCITNQASKNLIKLKSYQASFLTTTL